MSAAQLTPAPSNTRHQDTTLPLQSIPASHRANHSANAVTDSEEKSSLPAFTTVGRPSTPLPEPPSENTFPDFPEPPVKMSDTGGYPLRRYPKVIELESDVVIYGIDGCISRVSRKKARDHGARLRSRGLFPKTRRTFVEEDDKKMVEGYVKDLLCDEAWESTRLCGQTETPRRNKVALTLHEELFSTKFARAVNDTYIAMGGATLCDIPPVLLYYEFADFDFSYLGALTCEVGEVGDLRELRNVHRFRVLPYYVSYCEEVARAEAEARAKESAAAHAGEGESGDPEAGEEDGEYDETETF